MLHRARRPRSVANAATPSKAQRDPVDDLNSNASPPGDEEIVQERSTPSRKAAGSKVRVLVLCTLYPPAFNGGGPIRSLEAFVAEAPENVEIAVLTSDRDVGSSNRLPVARNRWTRRAGVVSYYISTNRPLKLWKSWKLARKWRPDVLYLKSFFSPSFAIAPQLLARIGWWRSAQVVLAPSGELNRGALALKARKKHTYLSFYRRLNLSKGVIWHASSADEASAIRCIFGTDRVMVRENETLLPDKPAAPTTATAGHLRAVFMARISPIKGLDILLRALAFANQPVALDIYGPEEDQAYTDMCKSLAAMVPDFVEVTFCGSADRADVRTVLSGYDILMLPTAGENFCHAIAEALSVSCPVMCTPHTPWTKRLENGGGVVVGSRVVGNWAEAINSYALRSTDDRAQRRWRCGEAYLEWCAEEKGPHLLELIGRELAKRPLNRQA